MELLEGQTSATPSHSTYIQRLLPKLKAHTQEADSQTFYGHTQGMFRRQMNLSNRQLIWSQYVMSTTV